jgi:RES domain-containing protein
VYDESRVAAVLQELPLARIDRYVTRFIFEKHRRTSIEAIGTTRSGGRYNPPGTPALYTALRRATALAEATQLLEDEDPILPMVM